MLLAKKKAKPTAFGVKLKELRTAAGLTHAALAEMVGVQKSAVIRLETSPAANPTLATLQALATALGCTPADLIPSQSA